MATNPFSNPDFGSDLLKEDSSANPFSDPNFDGSPPARGFKGWAQDAAATAVKGAISVPEAIVGLADIPTGGRVGKFLENKDGAFGFRPDEAKAIANDWHSDATKEAQRKFQEADGIWDKTKTAVQNPSLIATTVGESLPLMIAGGAIGRGLLGATKYGAMAANAGRLSASEAAALKAAQISAGAAGEGATMAGSAAEQIRQQTDDRLLSPTQAAAAAGTGVMGGVVSRLSGGLANKLGIGEADTMLTQGARGVVNDVASAKSIPRQVIEGAVTEGLLEELPQSVGEQILQNLALNKNWAEGLDDAVVMGALSGGLMGSGAAGLHGFMAKGGAPALTPEQSPAQHRQPAPEQPLQLGNSPDPLIQFRDGTVARQSEIDAHLASLPERERQAFTAQILGHAPQQADEPQMTTSPGAAAFDGNANQQQAASVAAPEFGTSLGAQSEQQGGGIDYQRQIDTSGLSLERLDSPFTKSAPATVLDRQALSRQGAYPISPPPAPVLDTRRLSEQLGLSSNNGGLESAAAYAVDSGATPIAQALNSQPTGVVNGAQAQETKQAVAGQPQATGTQGRVAAAPKIRAVKLKDGTTAHVNEADLTSGASQLRTFTADGKPRAARLQAAHIAPAAPKVVLQNRNRATPASIAQMNAIAGKPDFLRTGASNTMDNGAPIVFGDLPQKVAIGRAQMVADGNGQRVPTQYAVVEAQDLITSNHADGSPVAEYANGVDGKLRAVAGNGRAAGLKAAWQRGTAGQYGQELVQDAPNLGIAPEVLAQFEAPVLVRVMDAADVTPDMGDRSNVQAGLQMSAVEQASNDAQRLNLRDMEFDELGNPTAQTVMRFMQGMPVQERGNMLDSQGRATSQLLDRIRAAAFKQAYMSDSLVELAAQSADPEAKNILNGLAIVAGDMAQLAGAGDFDIRQAVTDAANMAVTAGRTGQSIAQYLQTRQIDENPETVVVMQFMAQNVRSAKRIADGLRAWAELAQSQIAIARQNAEQDTMFGDTPTLSRRELFERLNNDNLTEIEQQQLIEQQRRAELTKQGTQRPSTERAGNADGASDGTESRGTEPTNAQDAGRGQADFALEQQTPEQIRAQEEAQAQAALDKAKEDEQAAEAERKAVERQEVTQRSEQAADNFQLGQSAEENLSGQGDIFAQQQEATPEAPPKTLKEGLERVRAKKAAEKPAKNDATRLGSGATGVADNALSGKDAGAPYDSFEGKTHLLSGIAELTNKKGEFNKAGEALLRKKWEDMSEQEQALISDAQAQTKRKSDEYDAKVRQAYADAQTRRLEGERTIRAANGKPFKTEQNAQKLIDDNRLNDSHEAAQEDGGWVAKKLTGSQLQERENAKKGIASYTDLQERAIDELGLRDKVKPGLGLDEVLDQAQIDALDARVDYLQHQQRGMADPRVAHEETGEFGAILNQYRHDAQGAIEALAALQDGEAVAALHHPDVGDIDLVWGKAPSGKDEGLGLAKLLIKHPEVLSNFQGFISRLKKDDATSGKNRVRLTDGNGHAVVSLDWKGQPKRWLLTAYEEEAGTGTTMDTASNDFKGDTARLEPSTVPSVAQAEQGGKASLTKEEVIEAIRKKGSIEPRAISAWIDRFGIEGARTLVEGDYSRATVFNIVARDIKPNKALMDAISRDETITTYYEASPESIKALDAQAFSDLLQSDKDGYKDNAHNQAYLVLRHSNKKAELGYVATLGRMNSERLYDSQMPGGKLNKMAQPYFAAQAVQESKPNQEAKPSNGAASGAVDGETQEANQVKTTAENPYPDRPAKWRGDMVQARIVAGRLGLKIAKNASPADIVKAIDAHDAKAAGKAQEAAPAAKKELPLTVGTMPNNAEAVTVKDGVVFIGEYEALDYDSGEPVTVPKGSTRRDVVEALRDAGAINKNTKVFGASGEQANDLAYSRKASTKAAYDARIDALFSDSAKAARDGVRVLDRSDVMGLLGQANVPLVLNESHIVNDGRTQHPEMTAAMWKKVPEWLENPAAVYTDPKHPGKLTIVAPVRVAGYPIVIAVEPNVLRGKPDHLLVTAFAKTTGELPAYGYLASSGRLLYADTKKAPAVWRLIGDTPQPSRLAVGAKRILTEKNLAGWRRENNHAYSFAGEQSETADQNALATAQERLSAGEDAEKVRQDTGWHKGADGKWRFEISDKYATPLLFGAFGDAFSRLEEYQGGGEIITVRQMFSHPKLFAAYPQLANVELGVMKGGRSGEGSLTTFNEGKANQHFILAVADSTPREQWASTILHELQHGIQRIEGFASGGSPRNMSATSEATAKDMRGFVNFADLMERTGSESSAENALKTGMTEQDAQTVQRLVDNGLWEQNIKAWRKELLSPAEQYRRLAGEVEARNTQARQGMTDEQRRATAPGATQDVADSDVIVTFNGKEMHNAPMPANAQRESTAVTPANAPSTLAKVQSAIEGMFEGIPDVRQRITQGTTVVNDASELPENLRQGAQDAKAQALYDPYSDRVYMIASRIEAGQEKAVWLHEVFHKRGKELLGNALPRLHQAVQLWGTRKAGSVERQIYDAAHARAQADGNYNGEFLAYAIEEAVNRGVQPDLKANIASAGYWLGRVREAFANAMAKLTGAEVRSGTFRAEDLVAAAYGAAGLEVAGKGAAKSMRTEAINRLAEEARFAQEAALQRQFDETEQRIGGQDAYDKAKADGKTKLNYGQWVQVRTPAFKAWFGDWEGDPANASKVVDSETGEPMVVYHGSSRDIESFAAGADEAGQSNGNRTGAWGSYFTPSAAEASIYAEIAGGDSPQNVVPVYLAIRNPYVMNRAEWGKHSQRTAKAATSAEGRADAKAVRAGIEALGHDGIVIRDRGFNDEWVAFRPEQIKSSIGNTGAFDSKNPDIRFSRASPTTGAGVWQSPEATQFDNFAYLMQDKQIDAKRVIAAIKETGANITDALDVYLQETLYHGRTAKRVKDFAESEELPLMNLIRDNGLTMAQVEEYLHARHAPEVNREMSERNPNQAMIDANRKAANAELARIETALQQNPNDATLKAELKEARAEADKWRLAKPYGGTEQERTALSGMSDAEAAAVMTSLTPENRKALQDVAALVDGIIAKTRETIVDYGLETQETVDAWGKSWQNYVPLMREQPEDSGMAGMGTGQGFSVKGKETKGRTGSTKKVVDILANIAAQRERAIVRGEKNRVATALLGLVEANENKDFWRIAKPGEIPSTKVIDKKTGLVTTQIDPTYKGRDNALVAKVDGVEQVILFNEDNPRAMRMATALKNMDAANLEGLLGSVGTMTRYLAAINTQYNPIFGITNMVRDFQEAAINLQTTPLAGQQKKVLGNALTAAFGIGKELRAQRNGKTAGSEWGKLWDEFQNEGGQTGYRDMFANSADRSKALQAMLKPDAWADGKLGKFFTANGTLKAPMEFVRKSALRPVLDLLSDYNEAIENGVRLSAYKAALDHGLSKARAAELAKNLTVNFNRKGQTAQQMGALYAFFNASVQGTARMGKTLFDMEPGKPKTLRLSSLGKKIVTGGVLLGSVQALLLAGAGFDEDEPPEFIRERNLVIPNPMSDKGYITIPMPLGYHVLSNIGRIPTEYALGGFKNGGKRAFDLLDVLADIYNPLGGSGLSMQTITPSVIDPLAALAENKDFSGRAIAKVSFDKTTPGHALGRDTSSMLAQGMAQVINYATGGTEYTRGELSPTPDQIDYLIGQVTGGVGREASKVSQSTQAIATGDELPWHKVPLVGRFYGDADSPSAKQSAYYNLMDDVRRHSAEVKGLRNDGKATEAIEYMAENPQATLHIAANAAERQVKKLRDRMDDLKEQNAPRESIKEVETQMTEVMQRFAALVQSKKKP